MSERATPGAGASRTFVLAGLLAGLLGLGASGCTYVDEVRYQSSGQRAGDERTQEVAIANAREEQRRLQAQVARNESEIRRQDRQISEAQRNLAELRMSTASTRQSTDATNTERQRLEQAQRDLQARIDETQRLLAERQQQSPGEVAVLQRQLRELTQRRNSLQRVLEQTLKR